MMKSHPFYTHLTTLGVIIICSLRHLHGTDEPDTKGTYFVVGFLDNNSTINPELLIIPQSDSAVNITVRMPHNPNFQTISRSLYQGEIAILELDASVRMSGDKLGTQGLEIEASSDVVVYAVNKGNGSSDAFLALPRDALGDEYYVASYKPSKTYVSQVGIIGVANDTQVDISTPHRCSDLYINGTWQSSGTTFSVNVSAFETLQLVSQDDLTGAWIKGSSPLVVISGDTASINQTGPFAWNDHFEEQLSPTKSWGRSFATVSFSDGLQGDIFRIIASKNKTNIRVKKRKTRKTIYLDAGDFAEINVSRNDFISVVSSKPVLLLQYILANSEEGVSYDSYMLLVPPLEQRQRQYLFSTVGGKGAKNINLVIPSNMVKGLLLDGQPVRNISHKINIEGEDRNFSAVKLTVSNGRHNLSHDTESGVFAAMSYGFPLGMRMVELPGEVHEVTYIAEEPEMETYTIAQNSIPVVPPLSQADIMTTQTKRLDAAVRESRKDNSDAGWSPAVLAVIISLSAAVFFVIACILGFLVAELVCKGDGPFRSIKILPIAN